MDPMAFIYANIFFSLEKTNTDTEIQTYKEIKMNENMFNSSFMCILTLLSNKTCTMESVELFSLFSKHPEKPTFFKYAF